MKSGIIKDYGNTFYYVNDELHREDGPAAIYKSGTKSWWIEGKRHRIDGPAVIFDYGEKEWWYQGDLINCSSQEEFERIIKLKIFW